MHRYYVMHYFEGKVGYEEFERVLDEYNRCYNRCMKECLS